MIPKTKSRGTYAVFLLVLALVLAGCPENRGTTSETTPAALVATVAQQASPVQPVVEAPTAIPSPTVPPATATPTQAPPTATQTPTAKPTRTPTPAPPTDTPTPKATETPTPVPADAVVTAPQLNVRSGPGTAFGSVAALVKDDALDVIGQSNDCAWLQVRTATGAEGWVAHLIGGKEYTSLNIECDSVPEVVVSTPTPRPQPTSPPAAPTLPPSVATATPESELPPNLGCYLIQNQIGAEITVTINNGSFRVPPMTDYPLCLPPGRYNYTIDAPPPWNSINGTLEVAAGDRFLWPIRGQ